MKLRNRLKDRALERTIIARLLDEAGYVILSFVALWASARFSCFTAQFLALSIILGLKWALGNRTQVIQIFHSEKED